MNGNIMEEPQVRVDKAGARSLSEALHTLPPILTLEEQAQIERLEIALREVSHSITQWP